MIKRNDNYENYKRNFVGDLSIQWQEEIQKLESTTLKLMDNHMVSIIIIIFMHSIPALQAHRGLVPWGFPSGSKCYQSHSYKKKHTQILSIKTKLNH